MKYIYVILTFCLSSSVLAQKSLNTLTIGDSVPNFKLANLIHSAKRTANLYSDENLIIIDFWSTGCAGCVEALPKMQRLQQQFGSKIKILPVTKDKEALVEAFWKNNRYTKGLTLVSLVEDTILTNAFKHISIPHEVWIKQGRVIAITDGQYVDSNNISKVLNGEKIDWPLKYDYYSFGPDSCIFKLNERELDYIDKIKYSAICGYTEGITSLGFSGAPNIYRNTKQKIIKTVFPNESIFNAYMYFWNKIIKYGTQNKPNYFYKNQVQWEVNDRSRFRYENKSVYRESWLRLNGICYEALCVDTGQTDEELSTLAIKDLNSLLGLNVRWENKREKVLILRKIATNKIRNSKISSRGYKLSDLVYTMNEQENNPYVYDETNSSEKLDIVIRSFTDVEAIRKQLIPLGYDLVEEMKNIDKFIFAETNGSLLVDAEMQTRSKNILQQQLEMELPSDDDKKLFLIKNKAKKGVICLPSGLQYKIVEQGTGKKVFADDRVFLHYKGMFINGKIFDSSYIRGIPLEINVKSMIQGWIEGLQLMKIGSKFILYIPSELAYGSRGQGSIPPNSPLIFEIELLRVI